MVQLNVARIRPDNPLTCLLPILGAMLLVLIWSALFDYLGREREQVARNAITLATGNARAFAKHTETLLRQVDQVTRLVQFEFERARQKGEPFDLASIVRHSVVAFDGVTAIAVVDRNGVPTSVTVSAARAGGLPISGPEIAERARAQPHREGAWSGLQVGAPVKDPATGKTIIPLTRRLGKDATFAGVVAVFVKASLFTDFYDVAGLGADGVVAILGRDGRTRAVRTGTGIVAAPAATDYAMLLGALQRAEQAASPIEDPVDRVRRYVGYQMLADYPLLVRVGRSEVEMLAAYEREKDRYRLYAILMSLSIIGVFAVVMVMIVRLKQSHREAETNRATYKAAAEGSLDAFLLLTSAAGPAKRPQEFVVADANRRAFALLDLPPEAVIGGRFADLVPGADHLYQCHLDALSGHKSLEEEDLEIAFGGRPARWFRHQVVPLEGGVAVTLRDIDDERHAQAHLERLVNQDSLTSLPNRRLFIEHAGYAIERCRQRATNLCVLFIDLDNFKSVNDSLGHDVGDLLLQAVAARLESCVRNEDIVWRLGGDEFVVTMEDVHGRDEAESICRRIVDAFARPIMIREVSISTSASIGVAFCPEDAQDASALLRSADIAMYHAKEFGSGAYQFFTLAMGKRRAARVQMEQALRAALGRYEMFLVYQPLVDLADGRITGLEALVRWQHPEYGLLQPQAFIPIAEESNLIHLLGDHIFQLACTQIGRWQGMGVAPVPISVNLSARQFHWEGIVGRLLRVIEGSAVSHHLLQIELTESAIMKEPDAARRKLTELKQHGISLSVDDFGTGHSSLALLHTFPLDTLKIDQSFVQKSGTPEGAAILRAIVMMAHTLRLKVVAEGVETRAQCDLVRAIGCDIAQGFAFHRPVLPEEIPALLENKRAALEPTMQVDVES